MLDGTVAQRYLLQKIATAKRVSLVVNSAVADRTELHGRNRALQMHTRVRQAGEHDLAVGLAKRVNRGASPSEMNAILSRYLSQHGNAATFLANNRRFYVKAKLAYASGLLKALDQDPVLFLRSIKATTLQKRVNFTFFRNSSGGAK